MRVIPLIALLLACATSLRAADALELARLRAAYDVAVGNAARPLMQEHVASLGKLRDAYLRSSKLDAANQVQGEMDRATAAMASREFTPPTAASGNGSTPELDKLHAAHATAMERTLKPLRDTYVRELEKLRDFYARSADLDGANATQTELNALKTGAAALSKPSAAAPSNPTAAKTPAPGTEPRLARTPPKPEWYVGKTWVSNDGTSWTFKKDGTVQVNYPSGKSVPMPWVVTRGGLIKLLSDSGSATATAPLYMYFTSPVDGQYGSQIESLDEILRPKR